MDYETQRRLICALGRRMWEKGWVAANDGNLSRRLGEGLFLVTPAGVSKGFLSPEMLLVVDREGTHPASVPPPRRPSIWSATAAAVTCTGSATPIPPPPRPSPAPVSPSNVPFWGRSS